MKLKIENGPIDVEKWAPRPLLMFILSGGRTTQYGGCPATTGGSGSRGLWYCNLEPGHSGPHVAWRSGDVPGSFEICCVWDEEEEARDDP